MYHILYEISSYDLGEIFTYFQQAYQTSCLNEQFQRDAADKDYSAFIIQKGNKFAHVSFALNTTEQDTDALCEKQTPSSPYFRQHPDEFKAAIRDRVNDDKVSYNIGIMAAEIAGRYSHPDSDSDEQATLITELLNLSGAAITGFEKSLTDITNILSSGNQEEDAVNQRRVLAKTIAETGEILINNESNIVNKELLEIVFHGIQSKLNGIPATGMKAYIKMLKKKFPDNVLIDKVSSKMNIPVKLTQNLFRIAKIKDMYDNKRFLFKLGNETSIEANYIEGNYMIIDTLSTMIKTAAMIFIPYTRLAKGYNMISGSPVSTVTDHFERKGLNYLKRQNDEIVREKRLNKDIEQKIDQGKEYGQYQQKIKHSRKSNSYI